MDLGRGTENIQHSSHTDSYPLLTVSSVFWLDLTTSSTNFNLLSIEGVPSHPLKHTHGPSRQDSWENKDFTVAQSSLRAFAYAVPLGRHGI